MSLKWKLLMPVVSVATAGGISYPYLSSGDGTGVSRSNSVLMNLNNPTFNGNRSLSDINSGKASSLSVTPIDSSKNLALEIQSDSPGLDLEAKGDIMQTNSLPIKGIQLELDKENKVGELSAEQMKELKEAIEYVSKSKQAFKGLADKVEEYRKTSAFKGDTSSTRTFLESGSQYLTKKHRESIMKFYEAYSKLRSFRSNSLFRLDSIFENLGTNNFSEDLVHPSQVLENLKTISWSGKKIKIFQGGSERDGWGWGHWKDNPYHIFFLNEEVWREKVIRIQYALNIAKLNRKEGQTCASDFSGTDTERDRAIKIWCKGDNERFKKLIESYQSEIELDIASWLLDQMKIMNKEREGKT